MTDTELTPTPAPPEPGPQAWLNMSVKLGDLTEEMASERRARNRPRPIHHRALASATANASGSPVVLSLDGPSAGREWSVRRLILSDITTPTGTATAASGQFASGAASSVSVGMGNAMTGFDITTLPVATAASGTVTVAGLAVGSLFYELNMPVGGGTLQVRFPNPLPALDALHFPQVDVPAIAGGAAYAVTVYGVTDTPSATWYVGNPAAYGTTDVVWRESGVPSQDRFGADQITVQPQDKLFAVITGLIPGDSVIARADVLDYPTGTGRVTDPL